MGDIDHYNWDKIILDLCGGTGAWSLPYREAGYDVRLITLPKIDVRLYKPPKPIYGVLAAPPCTHLAGSGARWWKEKGKTALIEAMSVVDACIRLIFVTNPTFWALENPVGRLPDYLGKPRMYFQPWEYGDPYTKKTCLWGRFKIPEKNPVELPEGYNPNHSWRRMLPASPERGELRSVTPSGFARAFFEANR